MMTKIRQWLEISLVVALVALAVYFFFIKPPSSIVIPGTTTVIDPKTYIKTLENKLKGIDELKAQNEEIVSQLQKLQAQMDQGVSGALKETDIGRSITAMKNNW